MVLFTLDVYIKPSKWTSKSKIVPQDSVSFLNSKWIRLKIDLSLTYCKNDICLFYIMCQLIYKTLNLEAKCKNVISEGPHTKTYGSAVKCNKIINGCNYIRSEQFEDNKGKIS